MITGGGGGATYMTDNLKRGSLRHLRGEIAKWMLKLTVKRVTYHATTSANSRGRRKANALPAAMHAPRAKTHPAGSVYALNVAKAAQWADNPHAVSASHVDDRLIPFLDVTIITEKCPALASAKNGRKYLSLEGSYMCLNRLKQEGGWTIVRRPTLIVRPNASGGYDIISLYVTASCDPRIAYALAEAEHVQAGMQEYLKPVQFSRRAAVKRYRDEKTQGPGRSHFGLGKITMDGLFSFRHARGYGYYWRELSANRDRAYLVKQARMYCGMAYLEAEHAPVMAVYRKALSEKIPGFAGIFPGIDKQLCPASSVGASVGYACDGHNDSSIKGLTESIFWSAPRHLVKGMLPPDERWTFANAEAGVLFDLQDAAAHGGCCLYIPGNVMHNSMPTKCQGHTLHKGMGFVLINKTAILGPATRSWFEENPDALVF